MKQADNKRSSAHYPLDDLTYDVIAMLHHKSKGLEAFEQYLSDAQGNDEVRKTIEKIRSQDEECIGELQRHLLSLLGQSSQSSMSSRRATSSGSTGGQQE